MKLSKKVIAAMSASALLLTAGIFTSCGEEDDDTEGAISGSGKNYSINYTNSGTDIYRCWNTTSFKHEGELVKVVFNNQESTSHDGNLGFVWDLCQSKDAKNPNNVALGHTEKGYQNFFVIGAQNKQGTIRYYVSKLFNVSNLQADNFGASKTVSTHDEGIAATDPVEIEVKKWTKLSDASIASDKTVTLWFDIYPLFENSKYGVPYATTAYADTEYGAYVVDIYDADPRDTTVTAKKLDTVTIDSTITGYSAEPTQNTLAVYANVQPSKTLSGSWNLASDYAAAEAVEE